VSFVVNFSGHSSFYVLATAIVLLAMGIAVRAASAQPAASPVGQASTLHPAFALLDAAGTNVLDSGGPLSPMTTCGQCHDTAYIASHSFHADLGMDAATPPGAWNLFTNAYALPADDPAAWAKSAAPRLVGGGPAEPLGVEMDCFLCHTASPNHAARVAALQAGDFTWAATATLLGSGLVEQSGAGFAWQRAAFDETGQWDTAAIQDPANANCAQCHGIAHSDNSPLTLTTANLDPQGGNWQTLTTGQVIAPGKIANSGVNVADKASLSRAWDIHAERGLSCTDCHYALNNPAYYQAESRPAHLAFDPRRLEIGEYLQRPDHNLARGTNGTMRRCEGCHDAAKTHTWLPYAERHLAELACESCHIPQLYAPAAAAYDWTVLQADAAPRLEYRGVAGDTGTVADLITGYQPVLLPRQNEGGSSPDGEVKLAPFNLVTAWYWAEGDAAAPVSAATLQAAWFEGDAVAPQILRALDSNGDGALAAGELILDTPEKQAAVAGRLREQGVQNPRIVGKIRAYSVNHNVTEHATQSCAACHGEASRLTQPIQLAAAFPAGVIPEFADSSLTQHGTLSADGALIFTPSPAGLYIFGHSRVAWVDWFGGLFFVAVLLGVAGHGGLRFYAAIKAPRPKPEYKKVYMYAVYERFWHWLQTFAIVLLLFTGLIIHRPDVFGIFSFPAMVIVHNVLAALLVINAALSLFYHLVSGQIRQYIPHPYGFFDEAIMQAKYYLQGIFRRDSHPFEKTPEKKLNPLQRITYFGILNVLLPLQIVTGALMWGVQQFPTVAGWFGGLPLLAPFHSLIAWTFAAFIVGHVYLTTTGPEPLTSIKAMMVGWEDVEVHEDL
jgi:thiosulfate reductase cytochrome b subunit/mono/diheme cytochrome c family protein